MRALAGIFGIVCSVVIVAVVARYGYQGADNPVDGAIWAFIFGVVALGGLGAHPLAFRVWRINKAVAALIGLAGVMALSVNLSNSLGAMAGRHDEKQATRLQTADIVENTRRDLSRAQTEREAMRFVPTNAETVAAKQTALKSAETTRKAECEVRGNRCRDRETAEQKAADELAEAAKQKAATDRAAVLDSEIVSLQRRIEIAGPVLDSNAEGSALAKLFNLPTSWADWLTVWKSFALAVVAELLIVLSLVAFELLGADKSSRRREVAIDIEPVVETVDPPRQFPVQRPRLVSSSSPVGNVLIIMADVMEPGSGRVEFADAYASYKAECIGQEKQPVSVEEFSRQLKTICSEMGIHLERQGELVFLNGVSLKKLSDAC